MKVSVKISNGNLSYQIPVKSENELGYLASNLNYMADKLNRNGEYQRQFISNISHDFRSPLTSIKGYVEAMIDGTIPVEMQEKYLKIISYEAERLEKLTRGLLIFATGTVNFVKAFPYPVQAGFGDSDTVISTEGVGTEFIFTLEQAK